MGIKRMTEKDVLKGLDAYKAHGDELAEPFAQELDPLERLRGSVTRYDCPTDPIWEEYVGSDDCLTNDVMNDRDRSEQNRE